MKITSQQTQLSGMKLKKKYYQHPKTQRHLVCIDLSCSGFSFYEHFNKQFVYVVFYIQNQKISLKKNDFILILCWFFVLLGTASPKKIFNIHYIALKT